MIRFLLALFCILQVFSDAPDFKVIEKGQVINNDFYSHASVIEIAGTCKKDVYLFGTQISVDGVIEGDLICVGGSLQLNGEVKGALRGLLGQTLITGRVGKNLTAVCAAFTSTPSAIFDSNVFLAGSTAELAGNFLGDLFIGSTHVRFSGNCKQNMHLYSANIRMNSQAVVDGYLEYSSPNPIDIQTGAKILGEVLEKKGPAKLYSRSMVFNHILLGSRIAGVLMNLFFTLMIGLVFIKIYPAAFLRSFQNLKTNFFKSAMQGVLFLVIIPLIGLLLLITILGIPIAVTLIAFSVLGLYTAKIHTLYYVAERYKHKSMKHWGIGWCYTLCCFIYFILQLVPYVNTTLSAVFTLAGLGASVYIPKYVKRV